jgi:class 3 adenylate cyclase/tetratricopeptide (TPR) repeat protein
LTCSSCGAEAQAGQKFCLQCGTKLTEACPSCSTPVVPGARFCGECGGSLAEMPATEAHPETAAERRLVSVLFADLVGFTSLSEFRDPEEVREFLTRYFELARQTIERYGGTVAKFIGDAVMGVWGAPTAHEDDAERAVRTALDLTSDIVAMGREANITDLALRAGVATGEAAVTMDLPGQGLVAGDLVNTASRLQAAAAPGTVLVNEGTYRATKEAVSFEPVGDLQLKGKELTTPAWLALQVVARRRGEGRSERLEGPFVGRDAELRRLKDHLDTTSREGRANLVSVTGIAGIGKSRLVWEFEKYLDGVVETVYWHQGRSPAYGEGVAFWALGEMVRRRAGIAETDDRPTTAAKLAETLDEYLDEDERRWIGPRLEVLLGLGESVGGERAELFAAWRTFFERVADRGTTILVFEDLQWADAGLIDFIESMLEWSRLHPVLIVTLARPEIFDRRPTWGAAQRNFTSIHLEALPPEAMHELLAGLVPGLPEGLSRRILDRAQGVPLYAVETVRMLINEGHLVPADGTYRLVGEVGELAVPESLQALIAARLDSLPAGDRKLLQQAAVLGHAFTVEALAAVSGEARPALESQLRPLVKKELLALDADPRSPERGQYGFLQALIREVAYGTLARPERRALHVAAARYFEALQDDEYAGIIVSHYLDAHQATPEGPEAEALAASARHALQSAAERAGALHAHDQALAYLEQSLTVTTDLAEQAALWERAAAAAQAAARYDVAETYLRRAVEWYQEQGDRPAAARLTARLGHVLLMDSKVEPAIATLEASLADLPGIEGDPEAVALTSQLARAYIFHGDAKPALEYAERALSAAAALDLVPVIADTMVTKGWALEASGRVREGVAVTQGALAMAEEEDLAGVEQRARNNLGTFLSDVDPQRALAVVRPGLDTARKLGQADWLSKLGGVAVFLAIDTGHWDWALNLITELRRTDLPMMNRLTLDFARAILAAFRDEAETAHALLEEARPLVEASTSPQDHFGHAITSAWVALIEGDAESAHEHGLRALEAGVLMGYTPATYAVLGRAALWLGDEERLAAALRGMEEIPTRFARSEASRVTLAAGLAALRGEGPQARERFAEAARRWRDLDLPVDLGLCQTQYALLLGPDDPQAAAAAQEAREIFARLDSPPLLRRLEAGLDRAVAL